MLCTDVCLGLKVSENLNFALACTDGQERYMERDTVEMQEVTKSVSDLLRPFYAQVPASSIILSSTALSHVHRCCTNQCQGPAGPAHMLMGTDDLEQ